MAINNKVRIVIDPNVIGSVLLGGVTRERYLTLLTYLDSIEICYSDKILEEIRHFSEVDYFQKKGITSAVIEGFLAGFQSYSLKTVVSSKVKIGRDKNDYFLLSLSRDARAQHLTTGDPDLLILQQYAKTKIISMKDLIEIFE